MNDQQQHIDRLVRDLKERAKELSCLYEVMEHTNKTHSDPADVLGSVVHAIPKGWQFPEQCRAKIDVEGQVFMTDGFSESDHSQQAPIMVQGDVIGSVVVSYPADVGPAGQPPFLPEELKLLTSIAERIGQYVHHHNLFTLFEEIEEPDESAVHWQSILEVLRRTNPPLLVRLARKMVNYLCWMGCVEAQPLLQLFVPDVSTPEGMPEENLNQPFPRRQMRDVVGEVDRIFDVAVAFMGERETLSLIQRWINEDRSTFLVDVLENPASSHVEVIHAVDRYHHIDPDGSQLAPSRDTSLRVSLIRRFLTDQPHAINTAKRCISIRDIHALMTRTILPADSHGKLGGKSAGLYIAHQALKHASSDELLNDVVIPKTWYLASDGILSFIHFNALEDIIEQKYKDIGQVRQEYPFVVQLFKNSRFPPEIAIGLSAALDDFGENPLIVRSSSLLEDRLGTSFAGIYKSLFIANQGTKQERLVALMDAVAEVYASVFSPDAIEYRAEHGLRDFHEEMGIMVQEVVGNRVGDFYFPLYAGVAFSQNYVRWSPRIRRQDGLVRLVAGLGTRAVDRVSNDYPILIAPGQPALKVNVTIDEMVRYSPRKMDVIDLPGRSFETIDIREFVASHARSLGSAQLMFSVLEHDRVRPLVGISDDLAKHSVVVTFDGLRTNTPFVRRVNAILKYLDESLGFPVDVEFASDGERFYLLQCRPQSYTTHVAPAAIPQNISQDRLIFSANRYVSNGTAPGISHIVYVDPDAYNELPTREKLLSVGRCISALNRVLPKRQFILMGPGRWGSRGDIRLGVSVSYSDISNTAMLIEIARKRGDYVPELSFGTHFFQDLIERSIRYLPLYPDEGGTVFNEAFIQTSENILSFLAPQFSELSDVVHVIDVPRTTGGLVLDVLMNGEDDVAVGVLTQPSGTPPAVLARQERKGEARPERDDHWQWRATMADRIAARIAPDRFGVKAVYLFGSTKNATAGPLSDIDLIVHTGGSKRRQEELMLWFEAWDLALCEMNFLRTGRETKKILDIHIITDADLEKGTSFAVKIGAVTDAARKLQLGPTGVPAWPLPEKKDRT